MYPFFRPISPIVLSAMLTVVLLPFTAFAATDIGKVMALVPGASVLREGKTETLAIHAGIRVSDTIQTDATGRVKILFNDDSSVNLGPNTTMDMSEYADMGSKPAFNVHVPQGVIRAITGKIVDQNPDGFRITTPEATVGIRGTIVSLRTSRGVTTVYVENTLRQVYVNNIRVPSGNKITIPANPLRPELIRPEDRRQLGRDMALLGGAGVAAAAPEAGEGGGRRTVTEQLVAAGGSIVPQDTALKDDAQIVQAMSQLAYVQQSAPMGQVSGSLYSTSSPPFVGTFSFNVNLLSGAIANGTMRLDAALGDYFALGGGTGLANASGFQMDATGTYYDVGLSNSYSASGWVRGGANLLTAPSGSSFSVQYSATALTSPPTSNSGAGTGTFHRR